MKFDDIIEVPCARVTEDCPTTGSATVLPPSVDDRCADPAFAAANPDICKTYPRLLLKPGHLCLNTFGTVQLRTYLYANGTELEITNGLTYTTSDPSVAVIGAIGGNVTGTGAGIAYISVKWQNLTAFCQVTVGAVDVAVAFMVCLENSVSMATSFNASYPTKLSYGKTVARVLADELNSDKDTLGFMRFDESGEVLRNIGTDMDAVDAAIDTVQASSLGVNIFEALTLAKVKVDATGTSRGVIVLITDAVDNLGEDPQAIASEFKMAGGIIIVVALRATGDAYDMLMKIATPGFFLSAHDETEETTLSYLSGLKGYICAGNCSVTGDVIIPTPELDFSNFTKWTVTGKVDLIGTGLWNLIPGNGLYVDMVGSSSPYYGKLTSKTGFFLTGGSNYQLTVKLAGNQRFDNGPYVVQLKLGTALVQNVTITDWMQDFTEYSFRFTPSANMYGNLSIEQTSVPIPAFNTGTLLGYVKLENLTTHTILLEDDFDDENPTYIPPACGTGFDHGYGTYAYGVACYGYGCLPVPPIEQTPDPEVADVPPPIFVPRPPWPEYPPKPVGWPIPVPPWEAETPWPPPVTPTPDNPAVGEPDLCDSQVSGYAWAPANAQGTARSVRYPSSSNQSSDPNEIFDPTLVAWWMSKVQADFAAYMAVNSLAYSDLKLYWSWETHSDTWRVDNINSDNVYSDYDSPGWELMVAYCPA